jgi:8-oxo-dGTP pyrophosphatase MutT (NUDIX family)
VRELAEEAGVRVHPDALVALGPIRYESHETRVIGHVFRVEHAGPFTFPDGEVVDHRWVPLESLREFAATHALCADSEAAVLPLLAQR